MDKIKRSSLLPLGIFLLPVFPMILKSLIWIKPILAFTLLLIRKFSLPLHSIVLGMMLCSTLIIVNFNSFFSADYVSYMSVVLGKILLLSIISSHRTSEIFWDIYYIAFIKWCIIFIVIILLFQKYVNAEAIFFLFSTENTAFGLGGRPSSLFDSPVTFSVCLGLLIIQVIHLKFSKFWILLSILLLFFGGGRISLIIFFYIFLSSFFLRKLNISWLVFALFCVVFFISINPILALQVQAIATKMSSLIGVCLLGDCTYINSSVGNRFAGYLILLNEFQVINLFSGYSDIGPYGLFETGWSLLLALGGIPALVGYYIVLYRAFRFLPAGKTMVGMLIFTDGFVNAASLPGVLAFLFLFVLTADSKRYCKLPSVVHVRSPN